MFLISTLSLLLVKTFGSSQNNYVEIGEIFRYVIMLKINVTFSPKKGGKMKNLFAASVLIAILSVGNISVLAQDITIVTPTSEAAEGLDLKAVSELFRDSENLEEFEKTLNDPEVGINNLDLDENGEVDFIRVVEKVSDDTHVIILQVLLAENEFQDVATIEIEKTNAEAYNMQIHGNEAFYGTGYYAAPAYVHIHTWPIISWIYRPAYSPYRSIFYFGFYPGWYRPFKPVPVTTYRTRTLKVVNKSNFTITKTNRVQSVTKIKYKPRTSTLVTKKTKVTKVGRAQKGSKVTRTAKVRGKTTTVKKGGKKTTTLKGGKKTTVKKGGRKKSGKKKN